MKFEKKHRTNYKTKGFESWTYYDSMRKAVAYIAKYKSGLFGATIRGENAKLEFFNDFDSAESWIYSNIGA